MAAPARVTKRSAGEVTIERTRLYSDRADETGPFDVVGDVHGCRAELESLLTDPGGEPVDATYDFRVITQTGEVRIIELSAVRIEWAKQDAVLLFLVDTTARREAEQTKRISLQKQIELNDMKTRFISREAGEF